MNKIKSITEMNRLANTLSNCQYLTKIEQLNILCFYTNSIKISDNVVTLHLNENESENIPTKDLYKNIILYVNSIEYDRGRTLRSVENGEIDIKNLSLA